MRHRLARRKLGRTASHRLALFRNMSASLIEHGRVRTTLARAKELRGVADRLVTLGKKNTLHARRRVSYFLQNKRAVKKLFKQVAPAFEKRHGGYTRIYHLGPRTGDAANMALIEFLHEDLLSARVEGKVTDKEKKRGQAKKQKSAPSSKNEAGKVKAATEDRKSKKQKKPFHLSLKNLPRRKTPAGNE